MSNQLVRNGQLLCFCFCSMMRRLFDMYSKRAS
uniref:Uncharacterized protein n=1 Tax=Anguilla anguilla TaxID=7936 RepID=A0A0E9UCA7_ANGAN